MSFYRYPDSKVDSMSIWDDIIDTRLLFIENLKDSISEGVCEKYIFVPKQIL
jgi:hypothetical protein